ncbi:Helix-turn-helix domain-containing protein [Parapedobacter luteus]|uniref:Helix-turn-helix domain-containing protein n=1 Tax=Parapedobacter luteus TaxID=623280 RepID=A0A1T5CSY0_9SPHI|nr:helix-turn-helix transcriptional regulator [Parapedobacter luteus]SKB62608.1 Helix-turn-helix domain-containing protein [Parapedobacter luteus]
MDIKTKVGARLRDVRLAKKLTQEKVSFDSDIDKSYISEVENGRRNISIVNLEKLTLTLGISLKDFFNTTDFS